MKFKNLEPDSSPNTMPRVLKMLLTMRRRGWPKWVDTVPGPKPPERVEGKAVRLTFINHATVLIQTQGLNILTDPHYSLRCSPVSWAGPKRVHAPGIAFEDLPPIDLVLLSHNHYDHMDSPTLKRLFKEHDCSLFTGLGVSRYLPKAFHSRVREMKWWETLNFKGLPVSFTPVQHFSARSFHDRFETLWGGFVLQAESGPIYFPGDTAYGGHFKLTKERYGPIRMALLPIGAYEPRWFMQIVHMNPEEAVQSFKDLQAQAALAVHFGCFQLTEELIDEPLKALDRALKQAKIDPDLFKAIKPGEFWEYA